MGGLEGVKDKKLLYHLTNVSNMESIIKNGLMSRHELLSSREIFVDVADPEIISKREELKLDKYIPFHFHPYSAFDVAVKNTYPDEKFVYICIKRALAQYKNFKILIKHPLSQQDYQLYEYQEGIEKIDWETMEQVGATDDYSRSVKMAECLIDETISAELFQCVYAPDENIKRYIKELFHQNGITEQPPYVNVLPRWFEKEGSL